MRKTFNYVKHILILTSVFSGCVSISAVASLVGILLWIASSAKLKICAITFGIKKYNSIIKKKKKQHDKIALLAKS